MSDQITEIIEVHTSCGNIFRQRIDEMSNRQISGLIEQNQDHPMVPQLRDALTRRLALAEAARLERAA